METNWRLIGFVGFAVALIVFGVWRFLVFSTGPIVEVPTADASVIGGADRLAGLGGFDAPTADSGSEGEGVVIVGLEIPGTATPTPVSAAGPPVAVGGRPGAAGCVVYCLYPLMCDSLRLLNADCSVVVAFD